MSEHKADEVEREEIEMLLPWYVTGRLDGADMDRVAGYLARHPQVARQLDLIRAEREQAVLANEALGAPQAGASSRLLAQLSASPGLAHQMRDIAGRVAQAVSGFFAAPTARGVQWGALAAAALIVVQAAAITNLVMRSDPGWQAASGHHIGAGADGAAFALVVFQDDASAQSIARVMTEFAASIIDGPKPGGVYKIRLLTEERSQAAHDALLKRLSERRDVVRTVLPSRD